VIAVWRLYEEAVLKSDRWLGGRLRRRRGVLRQTREWNGRQHNGGDHEPENESQRGPPVAPQRRSWAATVASRLGATDRTNPQGGTPTRRRTEGKKPEDLLNFWHHPRLTASAGYTCTDKRRRRSSNNTR
jgi:hypothetical protein